MKRLLALSALLLVATAPAAYALTGTAPDGSTFDAGNAVTVADEGHGFPVEMSDYDAGQLGLVAERTADDHHEEQDGCDHGATSVPCRPDPSPNGKDCDVHGNHGGINEDHCTEVTTSTTTTQPPSTTTSTLPTRTTTTTAPVPSASPTTTTTQASVTTTTAAPAPGGATAPSTIATAPSAAVTELPATGGNDLRLVGAALVLLALGLTLRAATK